MDCCFGYKAVCNAAKGKGTGIQTGKIRKGTRQKGEIMFKEAIVKSFKKVKKD